MRIEQSVKAMLRIVTKGIRGIYRIIYEKPIVFYKKLYCPAINDFKMYKSFTYRSDGYYPAIRKDNPKYTKKVYSRVVDFDEAGIPMLRLFEQKYWPVTIAQYGLLNYNFYLTYKQEKYKQTVIEICNWFADNISCDGSWQHNILYHCNVVNEDIKPPYASAMVQGEAISLLVRGYYLTKNNDYLDCAAKALNPYRKLVRDGGVLEYFNGMPFYEEYPTATPSLVLNGFIFSLFGLYDLSITNHSSSKEAEKLFHDGSETLKKVLPLYDGGFCSRYDLSYFTAAPMEEHKNPFYHPIHVNQLIAMNSLLHSDVLDYYIRRWK